MRLALLLFASGAMFAACASDTPDEASGATTSAEPTVVETGESWTARGIYLGSKFEGQAVSIDHEDIPGLMDAMKMDFLIDSPEDMNGITEGDKVTFRLDYIDNRVVASDFYVLPDTTTLTLASSAAAPDSTAD